MTRRRCCDRCCDGIVVRMKVVRDGEEVDLGVLAPEEQRRLRRMVERRLRRLKLDLTHTVPRSAVRSG